MSFLKDVNLLDRKHSCKLPSQGEMAEFDRITIDSGVPSLTLMERAGKGVLAEIDKYLSFSQSDKISILCGPGNNGGDGLVIARLLRENGFNPLIILTSARKYSNDCQEQIKLSIDSGCKIYSFPEVPADGNFDTETISSEELLREVSSSKIVIDALLGTGQKNPPHGSILELLKLINGPVHCRESGATRIAVDLPTGLNGDTGEVYQPHFESDLTVCIGLLKRGMCQYPGRDTCGKISLISIGLNLEQKTEYSLLCKKTVGFQLERKADSHKGSFGSVFVLGGSRNMPGAPLLAASAALHSGVGLSKAAVLKSNPVPVSIPELVYKVLDDRDNGFFDEYLSSEILEITENESALVLGPGLGTEKGTGELVKKLIGHCKIPMVIDADALNLLALDGQISRGTVSLAGHVLTPHPGEMARLLESDVMTVQKDRYSAARSLAEMTQAVIVLKGAASIIYSIDHGYVNSSGNPYMATPGSGDVLAGVIGALLARGLTPLAAARIGVYVHGKAGDTASEKKQGLIIASDMIDHLPYAFASLPREDAL